MVGRVVHASTPDWGARRGGVSVEPVCRGGQIVAGQAGGGSILFLVE